MKYATLIVSALIIIAVLIPGRDLPDIDIGGYDKLIHICMFAVWAIAATHDFKKTPWPYLIVIICGMFFSLLTELLQLFVEGRTFDLYDMIADGIGLIAGLLVSGWVLRLLRR